MKLALLISLGGGLGTLFRHIIGLGMQRVFGSALPYGTFTVNIVGSFIIGYLMIKFASRGQLDTSLRMVLTIGVLGGFTTYSSFAFETVTMIQSERHATACGYVIGTLAVAGLSCYAGMLAARA